MKQIIPNSTRTFGKVIISEINPSTTTPGWFSIKLKQTQIDAYQGASNPAFALQALMGDNTPLEYTSERTNTQRVKAEVVAKVKVGDTINGHIQRVRHDAPQFAGQTPATDGFYYSTNLLPEFAQDIDMCAENEPKSIVANEVAEEVAEKIVF